MKQTASTVIKPLSDHEKELVEAFVNDSTQMHQEKNYMLPMFQEVTRYIYPRRSGWLYERESERDYGRYIFDGEVIAAMNRHSDGLFGVMCSPNIDWLRYLPVALNKIPDNIDLRDPELMRWCQLCITIAMDAISRYGFYNAVAEALQDGTALGTSVIVAETLPDNRLSFENLHLRECYISEGSANKVTVLHREFDLTYRQLLEKFANDNLDPAIVSMGKKNMEKKVRVIHAVYPRTDPGVVDDYIPASKKLNTDKPWASVYFFCGEASAQSTSSPRPVSILRESGFDEKPFAAWRYRRAGGPYGISPAMDCIYTAKTLNILTKTMIDAAELAGKPPIVADTRLKNTLRVRPGETIWMNPGIERPQALYSGVNFPVIQASVDRLSKVIRDTFKNEYFMSVSQIQDTARERTATEIMEMKAESAAVFGSITGNIQAELIEPLLAMVFRNEESAGRLPPMPDRFRKFVSTELRIVSPIAQAQRRYLVRQAIDTGLAGLTSAAQILGPDIALAVDKDSVAREILDIANFPGLCYTSLSDVKKQRQQIASQQAAMQKAQAQQAILTSSGAGKTPEAGSPADAVLGGAK